MINKDKEKLGTMKGVKSYIEILETAIPNSGH